MNAVDDLVQARDTFERGDWVGAFEAWAHVGPGDLSADDLDRLATVHQLLGHRDACLNALQRSYATYEAAGDLAGAVRSAFRLAMVLTTGGENAVAAGWVARADRLLGEIGVEIAENGYVRYLRLLRRLGAGDLATAATYASQIVAIGRRFGDADLTTIGLCAQGRIALYTGRVPEGRARFDEAMTRVVAGEVSAVFAGHAYCVVIEGCQEVSDLGRAAEWTAALTRWCAAQPGLVAYTGQCAVHRGQIMALHGAYREAVDEFDRAVRRYTESGTPLAAGQALAERGGVLRLLGDLSAAEQSLESATEYGFEPQPGLALLRLAQGRRQTAVAAIRRLLSERRDPVGRSRVLPAAIEVLSSTGDSNDVGALVEELESVAAGFCCSALSAAAAHAQGGLRLVHADPAGALPYLRKAASLWSGLDCPYELARVGVDTARALRTLGDDEAAERALDSARSTFVRLGTASQHTAAERLLAPESLPGGLTGREVEVLRLVAGGSSNAQIAAELVLSEKTVARHLSNIFTKLDVTSRTAAAAYAFEHHLS